MQPATLAMLCALLMATSLDSTACSPTPIKYTVTRDGLRVPEYTSSDYVFVGEVLREEDIVVKSSSGDKTVTSLRIRVLTSETPTTVAGEELNVYRYMMGGAACDIRGGMPLTAKEMPIGAKVRVITGRLDIPFWEMQARFVRVE